MKLYGVVLSPFVQRVLLAARFKGHELAVDPLPGVSVASPEFAAISPMRRIPVLADGDLHVCESAVIVVHLDEVLDGPALLPTDPAGRARARAIAQIVDGEFAAGLRPYVVQKAFAGPANPPVLAAAAAQMALGLDAVEQLLGTDGPWAVGASPTVADAALIPFLVLAGMLEKLPDVPPMIGDRPRLVAYRDFALAEDDGARTRNDMTEGFAQAMERRRAEKQQAVQQQQ